MKLSIRKGTTSKRAQFFVNDTSVTTGAGLTGLSGASSSLSAYYYREGDSVATAIPLTNTSLGVWAAGGIAQVSAANMPGVYMLGLPDAALATGASSVVVMLKGAANMAPVLMEVQLVDFNPDDAVRMGLTALPNAAAGASGGLPLGDASGQVTVGSITAQEITDIQSGLATAAALANVQTDTDAIEADTQDIQSRLPAALVGGRIDASVGAMAAGVLTAAAIAADAITAAKIATGAIDADALASDAVDEIWSKALSDISAVPGMTASVLSAINWLFALARNKRTQTSTTETVFKDDGSTSLATSAKSDDGTTFTRGEYT